MKNLTISLLFLLVVVIPVSLIDIREHKIPNLIIYPATILFLLIRIFIFGDPLFLGGGLIVFGFIPFFLIWYFTKGKMGLGDAKFSAFLALVLGIEKWFVLIFLSSFLALLFALTMIITKRMRRNTKIPYGPFLSLGALAALYIKF